MIKAEAAGAAKGHASSTAPFLFLKHEHGCAGPCAPSSHISRSSTPGMFAAFEHCGASQKISEGIASKRLLQRSHAPFLAVSCCLNFWTRETERGRARSAYLVDLHCASRLPQHREVSTTPLYCAAIARASRTPVIKVGSSPSSKARGRARGMLHAVNAMRWGDTWGDKTRALQISTRRSVSRSSLTGDPAHTALPTTPALARCVGGYHRHAPPSLTCRRARPRRVLQLHTRPRPTTLPAADYVPAATYPRGSQRP